MSRRIPTPIPAGWTRHDGSGCPVPPDTLVAVNFRRGSRTQGRQKAGEFSAWAKDGWTWTDATRDGMDIVGYRIASADEARIRDGDAAGHL